MDHLLSQAAADLTVRSEVEATLSSILQDIETAHQLEQRLVQTNKLQEMQKKYAALKARYDEREAAWALEAREKERLGVQLMEEIVRLSAREVLEERERKELIERLENTTRDALKGLAHGHLEQSTESKNVVRGSSIQGATKAEDTSPTGFQVQPSKGAESENKIPDSTDKGDVNSVVKHSGEISLDTENIDISSMSAATKVVEQQHEQKQPPMQHRVFLPQDLDDISLMNVFAFLDPLDVIYFAQTNKSMFSKIDVLFGSGGSSSETEDGVVGSEAMPTPEQSVLVATSTESALTPSANSNPQSQPIPNQSTMTVSPLQKTTTSTTHPVEAQTSPSVQTIITPSNQPQSTQPIPSKEMSISQPLHAPPAPSDKTSSTASPKLFAMPSPSLPQGASTFSQMFSRFGAASAPSTATQIMSANSSVSSAGTANISTTAPPASITTTTSSTGHTDTSGTEIKLNAAMANSMASKLSPAELSIILRMREKLQKCEADAERWRLEKEDVVANLASVEAVKEFLVTRVRDTEKVVQNQKDDMKEMQRKNLADQEVIVFLDERVKALEKEVETMRLKEDNTRKEAQEMVNKNEKKVRVLSDMLRFEREQIAANEKEWKTAKKVLVKEVKSCRARIVALEAEQEGIRRQNAQLKEGLTSLTPSGSPGPKLGKKGGKFR
mmetsp:Transcript_21666/g.45332  ORF Transcript_21666/g.45332 Transcript_21666/m.45332 type:complete len:670 (-) Transcript_21666:1867-3876(-)